MQTIQHSNTILRLATWLTWFCVILAFVVVVLGAYTRLKDAGLGCPDWPGCYGQLTVPTTASEIHQALTLYPNTPVEAAKAWPEMIHRYFVGGLSVVIFTITGLLLWQRSAWRIPLWLPLGLVALLVFQAILGMWTVTWLLLPLVVMGHLLGGLTIFSLLVWLGMHLLSITQRLPELPIRVTRFYPFAIVGVAIVACQIALGGWTSANYASLACIDFPTCNGSLTPSLDIKTAFNLFSPIGVNYQMGVLDHIARVTIQFFHRFGGLITLLYVGALATVLLYQRQRLMRLLAIMLLTALIIQVVLGILNVVLLLPLHVAVSHNGGAAILLGILLIMTYLLKPKRSSVY